LHQSAFAGLPGDIDEDGRRVLQSLEEMFGNVATNHGGIINHNTDDNQPKFGCSPTGVIKNVRLNCPARQQKSASKSASTDPFNRAKTDKKRYGRICVDN
jgi:hypothetical protein